MKANKYGKYVLTITETMNEDIKKWWGKDAKDLEDDMAEEIVAEFLKIDIEKIESASFTEDYEIWFELVEDDDEDEDEPRPEWSESYLNYIGMSMSDFI